MGANKKSYSLKSNFAYLKVQDIEVIQNCTDLNVYGLAFQSAMRILNYLVIDRN